MLRRWGVVPGILAELRGTLTRLAAAWSLRLQKTRFERVPLPEQLAFRRRGDRLDSCEAGPGHCNTSMEAAVVVLHAWHACMGIPSLHANTLAKSMVCAWRDCVAYGRGQLLPCNSAVDARVL